jgi:hypothetical protein
MSKSDIFDNNYIDISKIKVSKIFQIMVSVLIINFIFSSIAYSFLYDDFGNANHFIDFLYFGLVTISSTGYGDIVPITRRAKVFVSVYLLFIYSFMLSFTL